jgi:hypothetical protein
MSYDAHAALAELAPTTWVNRELDSESDVARRDRFLGINRAGVAVVQSRDVAGVARASASGTGALNVELGLTELPDWRAMGGQR